MFEPNIARDVLFFKKNRALSVAQKHKLYAESQYAQDLWNGASVDEAARKLNDAHLDRTTQKRRTVYVPLNAIAKKAKLHYDAQERLFPSDFFDIEGSVYFALSAVGPTLYEGLKPFKERGPYDLEQQKLLRKSLALNFGVQLAHEVARLHQKNVVYRDICAKKILIDASQGRALALVEIGRRVGQVNQASTLAIRFVAGWAYHDTEPLWTRTYKTTESFAQNALFSTSCRHRPPKDGALASAAARLEGLAAWLDAHIWAAASFNPPSCC